MMMNEATNRVPASHQLGALLELADLPQSHGAGAVAVRLFNATHRCRCLGRTLDTPTVKRDSRMEKAMNDGLTFFTIALAGTLTPTT